jgi:hypothetical protein
LRRDVTRVSEGLAFDARGERWAHENKEIGKRRRAGEGEKKTYKFILERFLLTPRPPSTHVSPISSHDSLFPPLSTLCSLSPLATSRTITASSP